MYELVISILAPYFVISIGSIVIKLGFITGSIVGVSTVPEGVFSLPILPITSLDTISNSIGNLFNNTSIIYIRCQRQVLFIIRII